jgi:hypothetical protein
MKLVRIPAGKFSMGSALHIYSQQTVSGAS